ncbi:glutathione-S-transferase [Mycena olivaceomarginata]|nr:glutathione-S-transferase [Mycena olivaceomarginata]
MAGVAYGASHLTSSRARLAQLTPHWHKSSTLVTNLRVQGAQGASGADIYAGWRSWIVLEEKGIPYQYKEVNPYKKEKHFLGLDINPKGLVPAVEYHGKALYESLVLCEFLRMHTLDTNRPSYLVAPTRELTRASGFIVDFVSKAFVPVFFRIIMSQEPEKQESARTELYDALRKFAAQVKSPYFLGDEFSLVDVAIVPFITRDYILADHRNYSREGISAAWKQYAGPRRTEGERFENEECEHRVMTRTSMQRSMGDILEMKLKATLLKRFGLDESFPEQGLIIESYIRHRALRAS